MNRRQPFGAVLKRFRQAAGLTHEALAERAGLGARTISDLERGVSRAPRRDTLALLVEALRLSAEQQVIFESAARPIGASMEARSPGTIPLSLPVQLTGFVGRDDEAGAVAALILRRGNRLVTLTGAGGVGKTRLAYHVAEQICEKFTDGVYAVALAPVVDNTGAIQAIDHAIGGDGRRTLSDLGDSLAEKDLLLALDNCEHLPEMPGLVAELLSQAPGVKILATSRARLRLTSEHEFVVVPLPLPNPARLPAVDDLHEYAVVTLFLDRASRVRPDFTLTKDNAAAVVGICNRLDGLPLALELAAAWIKVLPPHVLLERLGDATVGGALHLLAQGHHDSPERHQTLRDTVAWSHRLLSASERRYFRRLAVFYGGCTLQSAEALLDFPADSGTYSVQNRARPAVLDSLASLLGKSLLLQQYGADGEPRFVMLETIREYAWEQLSNAGEADIMRERHAAYYLKMVEATGGLLFAAPQKQARAAAEHGNIQAALRWLVMRG